MATVNINSEVTDPFYRYKMPRLIAKVTFLILHVLHKRSLLFINMKVIFTSFEIKCENCPLSE